MLVTLNPQQSERTDGQNTTTNHRTNNNQSRTKHKRDKPKQKRENTTTTESGETGRRTNENDRRQRRRPQRQQRREQHAKKARTVAFNRERRQRSSLTEVYLSIYHQGSDDGRTCTTLRLIGWAAAWWRSLVCCADSNTPWTTSQIPNKAATKERNQVIDCTTNQCNNKSASGTAERFPSPSFLPSFLPSFPVVGASLFLLDVLVENSSCVLDGRTATTQKTTKGIIRKKAVVTESD